MEPIGSEKFRRDCVAAITETGWYANLGGFFEKYAKGEDFDEDKLEMMGYKHIAARNLSAYINHWHNDGYYGNALGWE